MEPLLKDTPEISTPLLRPKYAFLIYPRNEDTSLYRTPLRVPTIEGFHCINYERVVALKSAFIECLNDLNRITHSLSPSVFPPLPALSTGSAAWTSMGTASSLSTRWSSSTRRCCRSCRNSTSTASRWRTPSARSWTWSTPRKKVGGAAC